MKRTYDINVLRHSGNEHELTLAMVDEAKAIDLDKDIQDSKGRLSEWTPESETPQVDEIKKAKEVLGDDIGDEPVNLDDIPF